MPTCLRFSSKAGKQQHSKRYPAFFLGKAGCLTPQTHSWL
jgi:hypothetical protein